MIKDFENENKFIDLQNWTLCPLCQKQIPLLLLFLDNNVRVQILILCQSQQETKIKNGTIIFFHLKKFHKMKE